MGEKVSFATTNWENKPDKPNSVSQAEWDAWNSSKFSGFPFPIYEKDQEGNSFSNWDKTTRFQGQPSKSSEKLVYVLTTEYTYKFTLDQLIQLFWRMSHVKPVVEGSNELQSTNYRNSSYSYDPETSTIAAGSRTILKDKESELVSKLNENKWLVTINGCQVVVDFNQPVLKTGDNEYRPYVGCSCCNPPCFFMHLDGAYGSSSILKAGAFLGFLNQKIYRTVSGSYSYSESRPDSGYSLSGSGSGSHSLSLNIASAEDGVVIAAFELPEGFGLVADIQWSYSNENGSDSGSDEWSVGYFFGGGTIESDSQKTRTRVETVPDFTSTETRSVTLSSEITQAELISASLGNWQAGSLWELGVAEAAIQINGERVEILGHQKYRIRYTKSPTDYLKVWVKIRFYNGYTVVSTETRIIEFNTSGLEGVTCGNPEYSTSAEYTVSPNIPSFFEGYSGYSKLYSVHIEKYSFVQTYEPDTSDPNNPQPNGFPPF